ncbi:restriction modification system DNA specificity domain-containing protein [Pseudodesulfovibrio mercurii]|uniref:Restriction modification system DNA specificity domain-containing protein n=1 Tax=Pseudodesulfovibrio mercurii TaxID=641491 RepID=F0JFU2_9BACT|nr:restriction endonuclease subunit S [Pseudodesulfovibrio mercurii]EGB13770.1 restriction modification system DNA specificity domain-containing protein [Pseudodesulfovibrio mercurii]
MAKQADKGKWSTEELPVQWDWAVFQDIFEDLTSSTKKVKQKEYIENAPLAVVDQGVALIGGATDKFDLAFEGDLPVIVFGDHTRCVKLVDFPFVQGADGVKVLKPLSPLSTNLYSYALNTVQLPDRGYSRHFKFLKATEFPVPPLNEQRRIADKIDALQAKSRRAREALETVGPLLEKFRQSVLAAAFRGDLTAEWREQHPDVEPAEKLLERIRVERRARWEEAELAKMRAKGINPKNDKWKAKYKEPEPVDASGLPELPEGWCWAKVEELACDVRYGTSAKTSDDETQMPVLRMGNIVDGDLVYDNLKYLDRSHKDLSELCLHYGDILFNRTNSAELVGKTAMFDSDEDFSFASYLIRVRVLQIVPEVVVWYINSPFGRQWVSQNVSQQVGQANINGSKLKALAVPIPPQDEQVELARKIKQTLAVIKGQRENSIGLIGQVANLDQSILAKAFRGELVPQDPNDEPASVLLERIKAERETAKGKKKAGRARSEDAAAG